MQYRSCRIRYYLRMNACLIAPWLQLSCSALDIPSGKKLGRHEFEMELFRFS